MQISTVAAAAAAFRRPCVCVCVCAGELPTVTTTETHTHTLTHGGGGDRKRNSTTLSCHVVVCVCACARVLCGNRAVFESNCCRSELQRVLHSCAHAAFHAHVVRSDLHTCSSTQTHIPTQATTGNIDVVNHKQINVRFAPSRTTAALCVT